MRLTAFILVACLSRYGHAVDLRCYASFAGVGADEAKALQTATATYEQLLDLPVSAEARDRLLEALATGADPFRAPEDSNIDTAGRKLTEFKKMLESLGWNTPIMRATLQEVAARRVGMLRAVAEKIEQHVADTIEDRKFELPAAAGSVFSPNVRYLVGDIVRNGTPQYTVIETSTGKRQVYPVDTPLLGQPRFNADGTKLFFTENQNQSLRVYEFKNGEVVSPPIQVGGPDFWARWGWGPASFVRAQATTNPNFVLAQHDGRNGLYLYDLGTRKVNKLAGTGGIDSYYSGGGYRNRWGMTSTGDRILMTVKEGSRVVLKSATLNATGKVGKWTTHAAWPEYSTYAHARSELAASVDHVAVPLLPRNRSITIVALKDGTGRALQIPPDLSDMVGDANPLFHPNGKLLVVPVIGSTANQRQVYFFDVATGEHKGTYPVPDAQSVGLAADGEALVIRGYHSVRVVSYRGQVGGLP